MAQKCCKVGCAHIEGLLCRCENNETREEFRWHGPGPFISPAVAAVAQLAGTERPNPEYSIEEFMQQIADPIATIDSTMPLPRYRLQWIYKKITRKARKSSTYFVQGTKPILPQMNSLASIAIKGIDQATGLPETVHFCFELRSFYAKGVVVRQQFYELRKSDTVRQLVAGSIALECGETYFEMLGRVVNPHVNLSDQAVVNALWSFLALAPNAQQAVLMQAARCIGMLSLILMEPSRQNDMKDKLCTGDQSLGEYFTMDDSAWAIVHEWDDRSKIAKGIEYRDHTIEEKVRSPTETTDVVKNLNVVNSNKNYPVRVID